MPLSSNSLIHFTATKDALKGILSENFKAKYCREDIQLYKTKHQIYIPMISFCDIPLSQIKSHIASYGHYGIGLSREWAIKKTLNPVLYVQRLSALAKSYEELLTNLKSAEVAGKTEKEHRRIAADIVRYIKNYEGLLERNNMKHDNYRYSDEREWRYVPDRDHKCKMLYTANEFLEAGKEIANSDLTDLRLAFDTDDIKYIIIKSDEEISEFVEHLRRSKGEKYSLQQVERLTTRILTSEQIHSDI